MEIIAVSTDFALGYCLFNANSLHAITRRPDLKRDWASLPGSMRLNHQASGQSVKALLGYVCVNHMTMHLDCATSISNSVEATVK